MDASFVLVATRDAPRRRFPTCSLHASVVVGQSLYVVCATRIGFASKYAACNWTDQRLLPWTSVSDSGFSSHLLSPVEVQFPLLLLLGEQRHASHKPTDLIHT